MQKLVSRQSSKQSGHHPEAKPLTAQAKDIWLLVNEKLSYLSSITERIYKSVSGS
jgi:hypothetical protein